MPPNLKKLTFIPDSTLDVDEFAAFPSRSERLEVVDEAAGGPAADDEVVERATTLEPAPRRSEET